MPLRSQTWSFLYLLMREFPGRRIRLLIVVLLA